MLEDISWQFHLKTLSGKWMIYQHSSAGTLKRFIYFFNMVLWASIWSE